MKQILALGLSITVGLASGLIIGYNAGKFTANVQYKIQDRYLLLMNNIANYSALADISQKISEKNISQALCAVNIQASARVSEIEQCLQNNECRPVIEDEVMKLAPELIEMKGLKITYYKVGETCKP